MTAIYTNEQKREKYHAVHNAMNDEINGVIKSVGVGLDKTARQSQLVLNLQKEFGDDHFFWVGFYNARIIMRYLLVKPQNTHSVHIYISSYELHL